MLGSSSLLISSEKKKKTRDTVSWSQRRRSCGLTFSCVRVAALLLLSALGGPAGPKLISNPACQIGLKSGSRVSYLLLAGLEPKRLRLEKSLFMAGTGQISTVIVYTAKNIPCPIYFTHEVRTANSLRLYIEQISPGMQEAHILMVKEQSAKALYLYY